MSSAQIVDVSDAVAAAKQTDEQELDSGVESAAADTPTPADTLPAESALIGATILTERRPGGAPAGRGWEAEITISVPQLQLLRDAILPTEIEAAGHRTDDALTALRERLWREREAQLPATFARLRLRWSCVIELPAAAGPQEGWRWTFPAAADEDVAGAIDGARAELSWSADRRLDPAIFVLGDAHGRGFARVEAHAQGKLRVTANEPVRTWIAVTVDVDPIDAASDETRFGWRERSDVATRSPDAAGASGRYRAELVPVPTAPGAGNAAIATGTFEDAVTGWALSVRVEQSVRRAPETASP